MALTLPLSATASTVIQGDVNCDGVVNINDVTLLIDHLLNSSGNDNAADDVNGDGLASISDLTSLIDLLLSPTPTQAVTVSVNGVEFVMIPVEGGTFTMGALAEETEYARRNEYPAHEVTLNGYYISQTEVTWEQWLAVSGGDIDSFDGDLHCPVVNMSLFDCAKFVDALTEITGKVFRLPTEAEWEFAARGGSGGVRYRFAGSNDIDLVAWYQDNADDTPHRVATKMPNSLGLYDMTGNVLEWCQDFYGSYDYEPQVNPVGPESGYTNVVRGGAWDLSMTSCHVTCRYSFDPYERIDNLGLRIVMNM